MTVKPSSGFHRIVSYHPGAVKRFYIFIIISTDDIHTILYQIKQVIHFFSVRKKQDPYLRENDPDCSTN